LGGRGGFFRGEKTLSNNKNNTPGREKTLREGGRKNQNPHLGGAPYFEAGSPHYFMGAFLKRGDIKIFF